MTDIEQKIKELQDKLQKMQDKRRAFFFKELTKVLHEDVPLEMLLGCLMETLPQATQEARDAWHAKGALFFRPSSSRKVQASSQKMETIHPHAA